MSKRCAKCEKTVYPTEELKCLDKVWHKGCFRCTECSMALNMKNYKGYNKLPYCNTHYPTTKFTAVAETPEMARLAQNTKIQSNIHYHKDFESGKGKYTDVGVADPEILRHMKNQQKISSIKYHEDFEKNIKGTKIQVADDPETARIRKNMATVSQVEYKGLRKQHDDMEDARTRIGSQKVEQHGQQKPRVGSIHDYDPMNNQFGSTTPGQGQGQGQGQWQETVQMPGYGAKAHHPAPAQPAAPPAPAAGKGFRCKALYDYEAGDDDEVGFKDGDVIINCEPIDDGWMFGTVERTGKHGMLPANYVDKM